jgi:cold shock CspA family protein/ribosome-associated translation inhibitor RaiA
MMLPVQTTFRNMDASAAVAARVQEEADKLDRYFDRITSCRVTVEAAHRHHRRGEPFHIRIELGVPGKELVVTHEPTLKHEVQGEWHKHLEVDGPHKDVYVAIRDAFKAMRRQLQDYVRRSLRHDVKTHHPMPHARVSKLFPKEGYGFIETPDGREIYFHKSCVLNSGLDHLDIGDEVIFSEEPGDKGPHATSVRLSGKHHPWMGMPKE